MGFYRKEAKNRRVLTEKKQNHSKLNESTNKIKFDYEYDEEGNAIPIITKEIFIESFKQAIEILKKEW